jgi:hypothetical protein
MNIVLFLHIVGDNKEMAQLHPEAVVMFSYILHRCYVQLHVEATVMFYMHSVLDGHAFGVGRKIYTTQCGCT